MDKNTKTKTSTKTSAMSEIRELTDDELNAVSGGAVDSFVSLGGHGSAYGHQKPDGSAVQACQWGVGRGLS